MREMCWVVVIHPHTLPSHSTATTTITKYYYYYYYYYHYLLLPLLLSALRPCRYLVNRIGGWETHT